MERFDNIVIGFGKGGKTLAGALAKQGESVALIERSAERYGGTCINVACIPTKSLENSARASAALGGDFEEKAARYRQAIEEKRRLTGALRQKNYDKAVAAGVSVFTGSASFVDDHTVDVVFPDGTIDHLSGERIFVNTGSEAIVPPISGLKENPRVFTSEGMMELDELPARLVIIGGGYIGLEFASYYANFGSDVTILQNSEDFIPREDAEVAEVAFESLTARGITIVRSAEVMSVSDEGDHSSVHFETPNGSRSLDADAVLVATGRRPLVEGLAFENAGIELTPRGAIATDEHLRTSVPHIWAMGDVVGGLQFTYISLDDSRIVLSQLNGSGERTTQNRGAVPYSVFLDPPLSRVGLTEAEAIERGYTVKVARMAAAAIPKANVMKRPVGMLKVIVDEQTQLILGAHLFCAESQEMINIVKIAMDAHLPYTVVRDAIYTHPTMSESLNDLLSSLQ